MRVDHSGQVMISQLSGAWPGQLWGRALPSTIVTTAEMVDWETADPGLLREGESFLKQLERFLWWLISSWVIPEIEYCNNKTARSWDLNVSLCTFCGSQIWILKILIDAFAWACQLIQSQFKLISFKYLFKKILLVKRQGFQYVGYGPTKEFAVEILKRKECPAECRPQDHQDWLYC